MRLTTCSFVAAVVLTGCNQQRGDGLAQQNKAVTPLVNETYIVVTNTTMRLKPTDDEAVQHPYDPQQWIPNQVGAISRGQIATVRKVVPFWSEVVLQDDAEGWIHTDAMLPAGQVIEMAVLDEAPIYAAPNEASDVLGEVKQGELVFALEDGEVFTPVFHKGMGRGYIPTKHVSQAAHDIAMGHLLVHAQLAHKVNDIEEVMETLDRARVMYPNSKLMEPLSNMVDFMKIRDKPKLHQSNQDPVPPRPAQIPRGEERL